MSSRAFDRLLTEVRACTFCVPHLPLGPRPVLRGRPSARLLIISQAPGMRVHETGLSFDDCSGDSDTVRKSVFRAFVTWLRDQNGEIAVRDATGHESARRPLVVKTVAQVLAGSSSTRR